MVLMFSYNQDPAIKPILIPFSAIVNACQVDSVKVPQDFAVMYTVAEEEIKIQLKASQSPDCGYAINYSGSVIDTGGNLPDFIILDSELEELTVFSDQSSAVGIYEILLKASVEDQEISGDFQVTVVI